MKNTQRQWKKSKFKGMSKILKTCHVLRFISPYELCILHLKDLLAVPSAWITHFWENCTSLSLLLDVCINITYLIKLCWIKMLLSISYIIKAQRPNSGTTRMTGWSVTVTCTESWQLRSTVLVACTLHGRLCTLHGISNNPRICLTALV